MSLKKIKNIIEVYLTTVAVDDILNGEDIDIFINPSVKELKEIIENTGTRKDLVPMKGVRFIIDNAGKTYVWGWDKATHGSVWNRLKLDSDVVGGIATTVTSYGSKSNEVAFDLGSRSLNKNSGYEKEEMVKKFFKTSLARNLGMTRDNTEVKFFEYNI